MHGTLDSFGLQLRLAGETFGSQTILAFGSGARGRILYRAIESVLLAALVLLQPLYRILQPLGMILRCRLPARLPERTHLHLELRLSGCTRACGDQTSRARYGVSEMWAPWRLRSRG